MCLKVAVSNSDCARHLEPKVPTELHFFLRSERTRLGVEAWFLGRIGDLLSTDMHSYVVT